MPEDGLIFSKESFVSLKAGYLGSYVFSEDMIVHTESNSASHEISAFQAYMNAGTITLGFGNRAELYSALGSYKMKIAQNLAKNEHVHYDFDPHFSALIGLRAILVSWRNNFLGIDAKGFLSYPNLGTLVVQGENRDCGSAKASDRRWQVGAALSHEMGAFIPYAGLTYAHSRIKITNLKSLKGIVPDAEVRLDNKYSFGLVFGFGITLHTALAFDVEVRLIEELAASLAGTFRF
jgi:hypothetical protein